MRKFSALLFVAALIAAGCSNSDKDQLANDAGKAGANAAIDAATNQDSDNPGETTEAPPVRKYRFEYNARLVMERSSCVSGSRFRSTTPASRTSPTRRSRLPARRSRRTSSATA